MLDECRRIRRGVLDRGTRRIEQFQIALLRQPEFLLEATAVSAAIERAVW